VGLLVEGEWSKAWYDTESTGGRFVRKQSSFRDWIRANGSTPYLPEAGRYHLYVSLACPWAHRTLIFRKLKGLEEAITLSVVDPFMGENGWMFGAAKGATPDLLFGSRYLHEIYTRADPKYTGRVTVPVLWDRERATIVNNESSEIIRMFNSEFDEWGRADLDYYPIGLRAEIDRLNDRIYETVNNGVYRCGFAGTQTAYEQAYDALFATLDELDARLSRNRFLLGDEVTEADWRLLPTLQRFDVAYYGLFKCNRNRIADFPYLWPYARDLHQQPGVSETADFQAFKEIYWSRTKIIPKGPDLDWNEPARRS